MTNAFSSPLPRTVRAVPTLTRHEHRKSQAAPFEETTACLIPARARPTGSSQATRFCAISRHCSCRSAARPSPTFRKPSRLPWPWSLSVSLSKLETCPLPHRHPFPSTSTFLNIQLDARAGTLPVPLLTTATSLLHATPLPRPNHNPVDHRGSPFQPHLTSPIQITRIVRVYSL